MNKIYKLFIDENIKTWKKFSTKLLIIIVVLAIIGALGLTKLIEYMNNSLNEGITESTFDWKKNAEEEIKNYKNTLADETLDETTKISLNSQIERLELAIKYDINPYYEQTWKNEILNQIIEERANDNRDETVKKLKEILEKDNFSEYIEIEKQIQKMNLDLKIITQKEYDDKIVILNLSARNNIGKEENNDNWWKTYTLREIETAQKSLRTGMDSETNKLLTVEGKKEKEDSIKMNIYRIDNNMPSVSQTNNHRVQFETLAQQFSISVIAIAAIIIAGGQISTEVSTGTIKFWALTPNKRWKILTSKLLSLLFYIGIITLLASILTIAIGGIFFNTDGTEYLFVKNGNVESIGNFAYIIYSYFAKVIPVIIFAIFALMLSVITRNTAVAVSFSVATYMGNGIFMLIINQFIKKDWVKFIPFNNLSIAEKIFPNIENPLSMFSENFATSTSLTFSLAVLGVCLILMFVTMYDSFNKRDII